MWFLVYTNFSLKRLQGTPMSCCFVQLCGCLAYVFLLLLCNDQVGTFTGQPDVGMVCCSIISFSQGAHCGISQSMVWKSGTVQSPTRSLVWMQWHIFCSLLVVAAPQLVESHMIVSGLWFAVCVKESLVTGLDTNKV